jgi:hypothetical protein
MTKLSILCFYLRIFPQREFRLRALAIVAFICVVTVILIFMQIFQCVPVSYVWEGWKGDFGPHTCLDINALAYVAGGASIVQDIAILILPIPDLLKLNVSFRTRMGIFFMFSLGIFILITSCIRLRFIAQFARTTNPTWDYTEVLIWTSIEVCVSAIVTSLPAIRVLISRFRPGIFGTVLSRSKGPDSHGTGLSSSRGGRAMDARDGRSAQLRIFSIMTRPVDPDTESQLGLELGDKTKGEVLTEVAGARTDSDDSRYDLREDGHRRPTGEVAYNGPATPHPDQGSRIVVVRTYSTTVVGGQHTNKERNVNSMRLEPR